MWQVIAPVLLTMPLQEGQGSTVNGIAFGAQERLVCDWFTNFENSRFEQCRAAGKSTSLLEDGASIECQRQACRDLSIAARRAARWTKPGPVWGTFTVEILGRVSAVRHQKRFLGDGTSTVLIEKVVSVRTRR